MLFLLILAAPAQGDKAHLQGSLTTAGGYTDNVAASPSNPAPGTLGPQADAFAEIAPTLTLSIDGDRSMHRIAYTFTRRQFVEREEANSNTHRGDWAGLFHPGGGTELLVSASATYGQLRAFNLIAPAAMTTPSAQGLTPGDVQFLSSLIRTALSFRIASQWEAIQATEITTFTPFPPPDQPATYSITPRFLADRTWSHDALGVEGNLGYTYYTGATPRQQVLSAALGRWRHDFTPVWSSEFNAGAVVAFRPNDFGGGTVEPTGFLAGRYTHERGQAEISYSHLVQPNPVAAQTFAIDQGLLHVGLPLDREPIHFTISGSAGLAHNRAIDLGTGASGTANVVLADGAFAWNPRPEFEISVRYQYYEQIGNPMEARPLPSIKRNSVILAFQIRYPSEIPTPPTRNAFRVDGGDQISPWSRPPQESDRKKRGGSRPGHGEGGIEAVQPAGSVAPQGSQGPM